MIHPKPAAHQLVDELRRLTPLVAAEGTPDEVWAALWDPQEGRVRPSLSAGEIVLARLLGTVLGRLPLHSVPVDRLADLDQDRRRIAIRAIALWLGVDLAEAVG